MGGLRLLDGVLGGRERVLKIGGDVRDIFLGFAQGIGRVGDLHRKLAGAHRVIGGVCRRIALQLGILVAQCFELSARGVDGLLRGGNAGIALSLHLIADALGILEASNRPVTGLARAGFARLHGIECGFETPLGGVVLFLHLFELRLELCCLGSMGIAADFCCRGGLFVPFR